MDLVLVTQEKQDFSLLRCQVLNFLLFFFKSPLSLLCADTSQSQPHTLTHALALS